MKLLYLITLLTLSTCGYSQVDGEPVFESCEGEESLADKNLCTYLGMRRHIDENLVKPRCYMADFHQAVEIQFGITKEGCVDRVEVISSANCHLNEAAISVINELPKMNPAIKDGVPVEYEYIIPVIFSNDSMINQKGYVMGDDGYTEITVSMLACYLECYP